MLVILVGRSGVGKSTFAEAINCPGQLFVSSKAIIEELQKKHINVTHDSIHALAKERYGQNPYWQAEHILEALQTNDYLVYDGPRNAREIRYLVENIQNTLVVHVVADDEVRYQRLKQREGITFDEWKRIEEDETQETGLGEVFNDLVDIIVENNNSFHSIREKAKKFRKFFLGGSYNENRKEGLNS